LPNRKNVRFHATCEDAEMAGFRPCKRCQPTADRLEQRRAEVVARACRFIEEAVEPPSLDQIADAVAMSPYHFHRLFKEQTGVTPKAYADAQRVRRVRGELARGAEVTDAIYGAGFNSNSRFYATANEALGMPPKSFRAGGAGAVIRFAVGKCWLGSILVAATDKGVCAILLGDEPDDLVRDLQDRFPKAELVGGDRKFERLVAAVVGFVERPEVGLDLPMDIRGTAFQQRVWDALRAIPAGSTTSYAAIARQIGRPKSVRAVGQAIAANPLAVAIPCHRVVRSDGSLCGYRWGVQRKSELLRRERGAS
jgi:AraC family transcriptional regulator of adaptative response/methylated-DNA-[protein]-cysteine methyltransferase